MATKNINKKKKTIIEVRKARKAKENVGSSKVSDMKKLEEVLEYAESIQ